MPDMLSRLERSERHERHEPVRRSRRSRRPARTLVWIGMMVIAPLLAGCAGPVFGLVANAVLPEEQKVHVHADYRGLDDKTVAVMVSLNEYAFGEHPNAQKDLAWAISKELRRNVPGVKVVNPDELLAYTREHPYWHTERYSRLAGQLNVDRIVIVDVLQYSLHEPGNRHIMQGVIVGDVKVIEAPDAHGNPGSGDNLAYSRNIESRFPENDPVGLINANAREVELATLANFSRKAGFLFFDHTEMRPAR